MLDSQDESRTRSLRNKAQMIGDHRFVGLKGIAHRAFGISADPRMTDHTWLPANPGPHDELAFLRQVLRLP